VVIFRIAACGFYTELSPGDMKCHDLGEILILARLDQPSLIEVFYLAIGLSMALLSFLERKIERT
jgi:hypothetical protein